MVEQKNFTDYVLAICIYRLNGEYLQTFCNLSESDCSQHGSRKDFVVLFLL